MSWDDFQELLNGVNREIALATKALEKMRVAFESLANTYQELIDYCKKEW